LKKNNMIKKQFKRYFHWFRNSHSCYSYKEYEPFDAVDVLFGTLAAILILILSPFWIPLLLLGKFLFWINSLVAKWLNK